MIEERVANPNLDRLITVATVLLAIAHSSVLIGLYLPAIALYTS